LLSQDTEPKEEVSFGLVVEAVDAECVGPKHDCSCCVEYSQDDSEKEDCTRIDGDTLDTLESLGRCIEDCVAFE
jgi:hypothetical protein